MPTFEVLKDMSLVNGGAWRTEERIIVDAPGYFEFGLDADVSART